LSLLVFAATWRQVGKCSALTVALAGMDVHRPNACRHLVVGHDVRRPIGKSELRAGVDVGEVLHCKPLAIIKNEARLPDDKAVHISHYC
jgi:hypothetical protein